MKRRAGSLVTAVCALALGTVFVSVAGADVTVTHGIGFTKGCTSPTTVGSPYTCSFTISNVLDDASDTLTITEINDVVHASGGNLASPNILNAANVTITTTATGSTPTAATCAAASGNGIVPTPYVGVTSCTIPAGARVNVLGYSYYTVTVGDYNLAGHVLADDATLTWHDSCDDPLHTNNSNCNPNPPTVGAASQSVITNPPPPPGGLITETNVDCGDVLSGSAANSVIGQVNYPSSKGKIGQGINPGKFFYWAKITTTTPNQVVSVQQSVNGSAALFLVHQDWARLYAGNCSSWKAMTQTGGGSGATITVPTPGDYVVGLKYDPKSLAGTPVPVPPIVTYTFTTSAGGAATVKLGPA